MQYNRVIPRDFFNESKLLKCMGALSVKILDHMTPFGVDIQIVESGEAFNIELTDCGSLTISNYSATINGKPVIFKTTYNSKENYPFYCETEDYVDILVFDIAGNFSEEFINHFGK